MRCVTITDVFDLLESYIDATGYEIEEKPRMVGDTEAYGFNKYRVTKKPRKPRSQAKSEGYSDIFNKLWSKYPKGHSGSKAATYRQFNARLEQYKFEDADEYLLMKEGLDRYIAYIDATSYSVKSSETFFGRDRHYTNPFEITDKLKQQNREKQEWEIVPEKEHLLMDWAKKHGFKVDGMDKVFDTRRKLAAQIKERRDNE